VEPSTSAGVGAVALEDVVDASDDVLDVAAASDAVGTVAFDVSAVDIVAMGTGLAADTVGTGTFTPLPPPLPPPSPPSSPPSTLV